MEENTWVAEAESLYEATESTVDAEVSSQQNTISDVGAESAENESVDVLADASAEPVVPIRFNHKYQELKLDEAATWAQKGMLADALMSDLRLIAAAKGQSVGELVKGLIRDYENNLRAELSQKVGQDDELVEKLVAFEMDKLNRQAVNQRREELANEKSEGEGICRKIANEFIYLMEQFPEIADFNALPDEVTRLAVKQDIHLYDAYLRYLHSQQKKADAEAARQEAAILKSTGTMRSEADNVNSAVEAMLKGLFA